MFVESLPPSFLELTLEQMGLYAFFGVSSAAFTFLMGVMACVVRPLRHSRTVSDLIESPAST